LALVVVFVVTLIPDGALDDAFGFPIHSAVASGIRGYGARLAGASPFGSLSPLTRP
jgi:hypothetical protein